MQLVLPIILSIVDTSQLEEIQKQTTDYQKTSLFIDSSEIKAFHVGFDDKRNPVFTVIYTLFSPPYNKWYIHIPLEQFGPLMEKAKEYDRKEKITIPHSAS
jgi:hypothetical protein